MDATEKQLITDIERLREEFTQTQDLYREVCALLFFRYGLTPTANKLYQLVRKGSMTAPADALNKFWEDLREKSRVRIEHPDLPEALKTAAGDLAATLWTSAQSLAQESLTAYRGEAQASVVEAKAKLEAAKGAQEVAQRQLENSEEAHQVAQRRISALEQSAAAMAATNAALESQLQQAREENTAQQRQLAEARQEFTAELDKLRAMTQLAEERFIESEKRALLEIDRERSAAAKLQKELVAARATVAQVTERYRKETTSVQVQLGDLRQQLGVLEGNLQAVTASRDIASNDLKAAQVSLADMTTQLMLTRNEAETWRRQAEANQSTVADPHHAKPDRKPRKSKVS